MKIKNLHTGEEFEGRVKLTRCLQDNDEMGFYPSNYQEPKNSSGVFIIAENVMGHEGYTMFEIKRVKDCSLYFLGTYKKIFSPEKAQAGKQYSFGGMKYILANVMGKYVLINMASGDVWNEPSTSLEETFSGMEDWKEVM